MARGKSQPGQKTMLDVLAPVAANSCMLLLLALVTGPAFPSDLAADLALTRGNVSNHLACLRGCGLVSTTPVGRRVRYELADPRLAEALELAGVDQAVDEPAQRARLPVVEVQEDPPYSSCNNPKECPNSCIKISLAEVFVLE